MGTNAINPSLSSSPFFRVMLWGPFRVEKRVGETYEAVKTADWGGSNYPRLLLKALVCCPGRRGRREALLDLLWPEIEIEQATANLNTATTKLRALLRPSKGHESLLITEDDATIYQLPDQGVLWVDGDAVQHSLEQAERMGRASAEMLPLIEEAIALASRGAFLEGEEGKWAAEKRATHERERYRGRIWLAESYEQQGRVGQAQTLLTTLLEDDPFDEDALCRLMTLLHGQGMTHQAHLLYQQTQDFFSMEQMDLAETTKALAIMLQERRYFPLKETIVIDADHVNNSVVYTSNTSNDVMRNIETDLSPQTWSIPYLRNPFFTGREDLLTSLHAIFQEKNQPIVVALCGLGGIGKTQLALEYAYRYQQEYQALFWIKADTRENMVTDILALASLLHLPEQGNQDLPLTLMMVKHWFQSHIRWLLIIDNADDLLLAREFFPLAHHGHVLLTTRSQALGGLAVSVYLEEMDLSTGSLFLLRRAGLLSLKASYPAGVPADYLLAQQLVQKLGGLPLALDQAGAYIEETSSHLQEYLDLYQTYQPILLRRRGGLTADHPESVATTWALAFDYIEQSAPLAADILRLCAFLDPDAIPEEILLAGMQTPFLPTNIDQIQLGEAIGSLLRFSLVRRNIEARTLTIHRLVQITIQQTMTEAIRQQWSIRAAQAVCQAFPQPSRVYSASGYPLQAVQRLTASILLDREQQKKEAITNTLWNLAVQQQVVGRLSASERTLQDCLTLCQEHNDFFNQAKAHQYLALLRTYQGDFSEAAQHLNSALLHFQSIHAFSEEGIVWAYYSLCAILSGNATQAYESAMRAWKRADEQKVDRDLIRAKWLLGWSATQCAVQNLGQKNDLLTEAHHHLQEALDHCQRIQMVDYEADLLLAWARMYAAQGNIEDAQAHAMKALVIADRAHFRLLRADIHTVLAQIFLSKNVQEAEKHASMAIEAATCEGSPYCYVPALFQAKQVLLRVQTAITEKGSYV